MARPSTVSRWFRVALLCAGTTALLSVDTCQPSRGVILLSRALDGGYANQHCYLPKITKDGRYVVFESDASNLVPGDTNERRDIFLYDMWYGTLERVSVGPNGEQANGGSSFSFITGDGLYIGFKTSATNLVPDDANGEMDAVVRDRLTGTNTLISKSAAGEQGNDDSGTPVVSDDGRYVAFISAASNLVPGDTNFIRTGVLTDVFLKDLETEAIERVSLAHDGAEPNGSFIKPIDMTPDGRYVLFRSKATNLVPGDTNGAQDVFLRDRVTGTIERVNVGSEGQEDDGGAGWWVSPHITPDGRFVAFSSGADNFGGGVDRAYQAYVRDRVNGTTEWIPEYSRRDCYGSDDPDISSDGRYVVFRSRADAIVPGDNDCTDNIFRYDRVTGEYIMVDRDLDGTQFRWGLYPSISADGRSVAFESWGPPGSTAYSQIYVATGLP